MGVHIECDSCGKIAKDKHVTEDWEHPNNFSVCNGWVIRAIRDRSQEQKCLGAVCRKCWKEKICTDDSLAS